MWHQKIKPFSLEIVEIATLDMAEIVRSFQENRRIFSKFSRKILKNVFCSLYSYLLSIPKQNFINYIKDSYNKIKCFQTLSIINTHSLVFVHSLSHQTNGRRHDRWKLVKTSKNSLSGKDRDKQDIGRSWNLSHFSYTLDRYVNNQCILFGPS